METKIRTPGALAHRRATGIAYQLWGANHHPLFRRLLRLTTKATAGTTKSVHPEVLCAEQDTNCPIHKPSAHHMATWPWVVRYDKHVLTERICEHGIGHPDPDSLEWLRTRGQDVGKLVGHACDGCCNPDAARARHPSNGRPA